MSRFGPRVEADGVRFRLWAPSADAVAVEVKGRGRTRLAEVGGGWKTALVDCGPGARYRFRLGQTVFPDPASRAQEGGVHGWSIVCSYRPAQHWLGRPWEDTVLYECHPGLMGGFAGIARKLPGLAALGVTAIELMPIAAFPGARNWGYDGVLPFAPAESYGSPGDLTALVETAHAQNVMLFLDVVYNHFGPDGNYLPLYAKPFFRDDAPTPWGAAIDFQVPEVREFFAENARHWLFTFGFDGLRFDAVHAMCDQGWLDGLAAELRAEAGRRQIHLVLENEDNITGHLRPGNGRKRFDAQWNDDIHHALHVLLTGEAGSYYRDYAQRPADKLARALAQGFIYQGQPSATRRGAARGEASADLPPIAFVAFLQNHDQTGNRPLGERLTVMADPQALRAAMALLLLCPQIPMLFMGEEIGSRAPFLYFTDHGPELAEVVRQGRAREFAGFMGQRHALADPNAPESFAASDPVRDAPEEESWRALVHDILALRRARIMPHLWGARALEALAVGEKAVVVQWDLGEGGILTLACNLGGEVVAAALPTQGRIWGDESDDAIPAHTTLAWIGPRIGP